MNYYYPQNMGKHRVEFDHVASLLAGEYLGPNRIGWYFHYLLYFTIQAYLQKRSLSADEWASLQKHLRMDANAWGMSQSAVIALTRENFKFVTNHMIQQISNIEQGKVDNNNISYYYEKDYDNIPKHSKYIIKNTHS